MMPEQIATNTRIMDHIIRKYRPPASKQQQDLSNPKMLTNKQLSDSMHVGLEEIAKHLSKLSSGRLELENVRAPQKKLYVMIIGNHSAGKSSFINWYIGQDLQKTRVSIETIEVNMIMHGKQNTELSGHNVIKMLPFMEEL